MDRKSLHRKIFVGPMTKNVVDEIKYFNTNQRDFFGLIPSRRQVECKQLGGGYVNNWTTENFSEYVSEEALILRDHGGPHQGLEKDNGIESLESDIKSGIKFLHIDPWKSVRDFDTGIKRTINIIDHCISVDSNCFFEVGTEEAIFPYSANDLSKLLSQLEKHLGEDFARVVYGVVQSGTSISGMRNTGDFSKEKSSDMSSVCHNFGVYAKEHNSDYLTAEEIKLRVSAGVDSLNIAPELGVLETNSIMDILCERDALMEKFIKICYDSGKWKKWVTEEPEKKVIAKICGHYVFATSEYQAIKKKLSEDFEVDNLICSKIRQKLNEIYQTVGS